MHIHYIYLILVTVDEYEWLLCAISRESHLSFRNTSTAVKRADPRYLNLG